MAWAIDIGGGNNRLDLASPIALAVGDTLEIRAKGKAGNLSGSYRLCGKSNEYRNLVELGSSYIRVRFNTGTNYDVSTGYVQPPIDQWFTFELERTSSTLYTVRLDGNVIGTINQSVTFAPNSVGGFYNSTLYGEIEYFRSGDIHLDPDASDRNNTGAQPVVVDTIGSNDATGYSMPTDGSVWVDLGGGTTEATITETGPSFTDSISISVSQNITSNITESGPSFTDTINATITSLAINASITESGPSFTDSISVDVSSLNINASITEQGPSFTDAISVDLSYNLTANISEQGPSFTDLSNISVLKAIDATITENGPSFTESIRVTLPGGITVNNKYLTRVKRNSIGVRIKSNSSIKRVK